MCIKISDPQPPRTTLLSLVSSTSRHAELVGTIIETAVSIASTISTLLAKLP